MTFSVPTSQDVIKLWDGMWLDNKVVDGDKWTSDDEKWDCRLTCVIMLDRRSLQILNVGLQSETFRREYLGKKWSVN